MRSLIFFFLIFLVEGCQSQKPAQETERNLPAVHGHRGSRGSHPENTLSGFAEAMEAKADWIELDLFLSKEGIPVVSHDPVVSADRCLDSKKRPLSRVIPIKSLTVKQLKQFDCGSVLHPQFPEQITSANQTIPTLEDVFLWSNRLPGQRLKFNIELKIKAPKKEWEPNPKVFVEAVLKLIRKHKMLDQIVLQSFDLSVLKEAKAQEPRLRLSALFEKPGALCQTAQQSGASFVSPEFSLLNPEMVQECHSLGLEVHPWTLNSEAEWKRAVDLGVDGIITDYPRKLITFLKVVNRP